jgi:hypothetical protein
MSDWLDTARLDVPLPPDNSVGRKLFNLMTAYGWHIVWPNQRPVPDDAWPIDLINAEVAAQVAAARCEGI